MQAAFVDDSDPRWDEFLEDTPHDVYHRPAYGRLLAEPGVGRALAFLGESHGTRCLIPIVVRPLPPGLEGGEGWRDAVSPYGYANPLLRGDPDRLGELLQTFAACCAERGIVAAFLRGHPLLPPELLAQHGWKSGTSFAETTPRGDTVSIDLRRTEEEIWSGHRPAMRTSINRLRRLGFTAAIDDWSQFDRFVELYHATMNRVGAASSYFFSKEHFDALRRVLGDHLHLNTVYAPDGRVASSSLLFIDGGIVQSHLNGWDPELMELSPSKLSIDSSWRWARQAGASWFHIGGGVGGKNDALLSYKLGFSRLTRPFRTMNVVADAAAYAELVRRSGASPGDFFPAYRAPAALRRALEPEAAGAAAG
ncbi:MAG TPA: GNAT family N-acetyltransferase [Vulgatibacter sp.]